MKKFITAIIVSTFLLTLVPIVSPSAALAATTTTSKHKATTVSVSMTAKDFAFVPSVINAHVGDTVKIKLTGADNKHSFVLSAFHQNVTIMPGKTKTFSFKVTKKGTFTFHCGVPCGPGHAEMTGSLIVT